MGLAVVTACGGDTATLDRSNDTVGGVGSAPPGRDGPLTLPPGGTLASGAEVPTPDAPVGERALGNRLVLIGDSILAGTSSRYGDEACTTLVPLGWQVAVEAEVGRAVDFGNRVLDERPPEEWDAAVVFLGTNYGGDEVRYEIELDRILDRLAPRPVVLVTVTNHSSLQPEVNAVIEDEVAARDTVDVFDWTTASEYPGVLSGDGIHPSDEGRQLLVDGLAEILGRAPVVAGSPADCLDSEMQDDSTGSGPRPSMPQSSGSGSVTRPSTVVTPSTGASATTTVAPTPDTTGAPSPETSPPSPPTTASPPTDSTP